MTPTIRLGDDLVAQACFCLGKGRLLPNGTTTQFGRRGETTTGTDRASPAVITSNGVVSPNGCSQASSSW